MGTTHFLTNKHHLRPPSTQHSSLPILSSTHPLIPETEHSTMDSPRGSHLDNGKSPTPPVGFRPQNGGIIKVQPPRREDLQPSYAQTLQGDEEGAVQGWYGSMINSLGSCIGFLGAIPCCVICPNPYKPVSQGNVGLITKFGRFTRAVDPGLVKINPLSERLIQVDVKIQIVEVPRQVCMTKDNVTLHLTSVIYYHITSPHKAAFGISNVRQALVERTQTTLRHVVGARVLQDVIERREEIAQSIGEIIEDVAMGWGVQVESMLIKDIIFSNDLQDSLSMAAQSKRIGESKVIAARAEVESAKLPISFLPHLLCRSDISRQCKPWPSPPTPRSFSCQELPMLDHPWQWQARWAKDQNITAAPRQPRSSITRTILEVRTPDFKEPLMLMSSRTSKAKPC